MVGLDEREGIDQDVDSHIQSAILCVLMAGSQKREKTSVVLWYITFVSIIHHHISIANFMLKLCNENRLMCLLSLLTTPKSLPSAASELVGAGGCGFPYSPEDEDDPLSPLRLGPAEPPPPELSDSGESSEEEEEEDGEQEDGAGTPDVADDTKRESESRESDGTRRESQSRESGSARRESQSRESTVPNVSHSPESQAVPDMSHSPESRQYQTLVTVRRVRQYQT